MPVDPRPLAVVTGASSGIGYQLAIAFAEHGFDLFVAAEGDLGAVQSAVEEAGATVAALQADLATAQGVEELYAAVTTTGRPIEALAVNAGVGVGGRFTETDLEDERRLIELNVMSTVHLAKRAAQDMAERGRGRILFTSSEAARLPAPFQAVYGASKAFVQSFAQALRSELSDHGVSVTAVLPGPTETEFFDRAGMQDTPVGQAKKDDPAQVARQAVQGLLDGDANVAGGSLSTRVQTRVAQAVPDQAGAAMHRRLTEPKDDD